MQISGKSLTLPSGTVVLRRGSLVIQVRGLPIGTSERLRDLIPSPRAPLREFARDKRGSLLRDADGAAVPLFNTADPHYQEALRHANRRFSMLMIEEGLQGGNASFSRTREQFTKEGKLDGPAYADALRRELVESGLAEGELTQVLEAIMRISGIGEPEIEGARADFLPPPAPDLAGPSPQTPAEPNCISATESGKGSA
jgi:hypothetical protein